MSIGKRKTSGNFLARCRIDGRTAGIYQEDRVYTEGQGWDTEQKSIPYGKFRAVFDMPHLERGYADFSGSKPDLVFKPLGQDIGDPPTPNHKEGIRVLMKMDASLGGTVRELISTAIGVYNSFDVLHNKYEEGLADHPDQLPIVECAGVTEEKIGAGTSAAPVWWIAGWVSRPPELPAGGIPLPKRTTKTIDNEESATDGAALIESIAALAAKKEADHERVEAIAAQKLAAAIDHDMDDPEPDHEMAEAIAAKAAKKKAAPTGASGGGYGGMDDEIPFSPCR